MAPMNGLPVLQTRRLRLYVAGPEAAEECARFNRENAEFLAPWEPRMSASSFDVEGVREVLERAAADALEGRAYSFALTKADENDSNATIIGWLRFTNIVRSVFQATALGYKLAENAQHRGYMIEAARAGIDFAFGTLRLHRIMAAYLPNNHRSKSVLSRLGFKIEGYAKAYLFIDGEWRDHVLTSLVNPENAAPGA
jgi:ribosomal-protein-alanine N-acetyltransferase